MSETAEQREGQAIQPSPGEPAGTQAATQTAATAFGTESQTAAPVLPLPATTPQAGILEKVVEFYHKTIFKSGRTLRYLRRLGFTADVSLLKTFRIGYASGRLSEILPQDGDMKSRLKTAGVLTETGKELFLQCVVFPVCDSEGKLLSMHGINTVTNEPACLPGIPTALWNTGSARIHNQIMLTGSVLDSLSLVSAGYVNTCALVQKSIKACDIVTLQQLGVKQIILAGADRFIQDMKAQLPMFEIRIVPFDKGVTEYLAHHGGQSLADYVHQSLNAGPETMLSDGSIRHIDDGFCVQFGRRRYEVRGIEKSSKKTAGDGHGLHLKATIRVEHAGSPVGEKMHIDTLDFYTARSRRTLAQDLCCLFEEAPHTIDSDISRLITLCEEYKKQDVPEGGSVQTARMTTKEREEAEEFGKSPDIKARILRDFEECGLVGEESNKFLCYLAAVSRKMEDPVSVLILASSGAGKTKLQDTALLLCPPEDVVKLTSLSGKALFYKGSKSLKHKILALAEEAGAEEAAYAIRNLISAGELVIEVTVKDLNTGKMTTMENRVEGPTAVFITTTNPEVDPETRSRFFVTSIDESREQTRAILTFQRKRHTLEGRTGNAIEALIRKHRNFQRLLRQIMVVNPYAEKLVYTDDRLQSRRDQPKYLNLINAVAFLRQMQKEIKQDKAADGKTAREYIAVDLEDIRLANEMACDVLGRSLDDLNSVSRDLLELVDKMVGEKVGALKDQKTGKLPDRRDIMFSRRDIREYTGWPHARVQRYLQQLVDMEYLRVVALFCRYLHEHEHVFVNPAAGMETVGPDRSLQPVPTEDEIRTLLTLPDTSSPLGIRDRALFEVIYSTAARNGETVNMNVKDVDLVAGTIRIMGKGMRERVVPLGKSATEWLTRYLAEVRDTLGGKPEEPALWLNSLGARLSGQVLGIMIKGYARACESIKTEITTHSLRRACATHMLQHGANPPEIQLLLGHGDLSHLRNYLRLTVVDLKAAHQKTAVGE